MRHKIVLAGIILALAGTLWYILSGGSSVGSKSLLGSQVVQVNGPDQELVETLLALRAVKLEGTIFSEPAFQTLRDFSTSIVPEPVGRPNPFAPLGASSTASASSTKSAQIFTPGGSTR